MEGNDGNIDSGCTPAVILYFVEIGACFDRPEPVFLKIILSYIFLIALKLLSIKVLLVLPGMELI